MNRIRDLAAALLLGLISLTAPARAEHYTASPSIAPSTFFGTSNPAISIPNHSCGSIGVNPGLWAGQVNCYNGNLSEFERDISIAGRLRPLEVNRTYNALDAASGGAGMFGPGWSCSYCESLTFNRDRSIVTVHQGGGGTVTFTKTESGYAAPAYVTASLTKNPDNTYKFTLKNQLGDIFDADGRLIAQTDRSTLKDFETTLKYDYLGNLSSVTDAAGRTITFTTDPYCNASGQGTCPVTQVADSFGRTVSYSYDNSGNLAAVTDMGGGVTSYAYDSNHLLTSVTDPLGGRVSNRYDGSATVVSRTNQLGKVTTYSYESGTNANTTTITDPKGDVQVRTYSDYVETSITLGYGTKQAATWSYGYDSGFNRVMDIDANGNTWKSVYDRKGNLVKSTDPLGDTVRIVYNWRNDPVAVTDANGVTTSYTYDLHGDLTSISRPLEGTSRTYKVIYVYDPKWPGCLKAIIGPTGATTTYLYYSNGIVIIDPDGDKTSLNFDYLGRLISIVSPLGNETTYTYDNFGDLTSVTDPLGNSASWTYDPKRQLTSYADKDNRTTRFKYDAAGRYTEAVRNDGTTLAYGYDDAGNLTSQTDAMGHKTTFTYDALNRWTGETDPLGRGTGYSYDYEGNRTSRTDPDGQTVFAYDAARRLTRVSYSDGRTPGVTFEYDPVGRRVAMNDGSGRSTFRFDSLGRMTRSVNGAGRVVSYHYDLRGLPLAVTYPNKKSVSRQYTRGGRLQSVTDWHGNSTKFHFDADGNIIRTTYPNGYIGQYEYDNADRLVVISYGKNRANEFGFSYDRTKAGFIAKEYAPSITYTYTYDLIERLTNVSGQSAYAYDDADRITTATPAAGAPVEFAYDDADQLATMMKSGAESDFSYDPRGNRIGLSLPSGPDFSYTYDLANRLTGFAGKGTEANYAYDGDGLRISRTVGSTTEYYTWNRTGRLPLILAAGNASYIYGLGSAPLEQVSESGEVLFYHADQLGSTRALTDSKGSKIASYSYDAYGNTLNASISGQVSNPFGYAGSFTDAETGFLYLRARYYDPATEQFISRDPLVAVTGQPYAYADDSPVNFVDPTGAGWDALDILEHLMAKPAICDKMKPDFSTSALSIRLLQFVTPAKPVPEGLSRGAGVDGR